MTNITAQNRRALRRVIYADRHGNWHETPGSDGYQAGNRLARYELAERGDTVSDTASKHIPGPWIRSKHGFQVLTADSKRVVCTINVGGDREKQVATASLIAAAPMMLAALDVAWQLAEIASDWNLSEIEIDGEMMSIYDVMDVFEKALKRARVG